MHDSDDVNTLIPNCCTSPIVYRVMVWLPGKNALDTGIEVQMLFHGHVLPQHVMLRAHTDGQLDLLDLCLAVVPTHEGLSGAGGKYTRQHPHRSSFTRSILTLMLALIYQ